VRFELFRIVSNCFEFQLTRWARTRYSFRQLEQTAYRRLGVVFYSYHTGTWWYELVDLLRKLTLTGLLVFAGPGSSGQVAIGLSVCVAMVFLNVQLRPFLDTYQNTVNMLLLIQLSLMLFVGLMLRVKVLDDDSRTAGTVGVVLVGLNVCIFALPFMEVLALVASFFAQRSELHAGSTHYERMTSRRLQRLKKNRVHKFQRLLSDR
jgi:hypothetical protein